MRLILTYDTDRPYLTRFIPNRDAAEIVNLYHLARTAVGDDRHARMVQAAKWYHEAHPEIKRTGAYKDLCGLLA